MTSLSSSSASFSIDLRITVLIAALYTSPCHVAMSPLLPETEGHEAVACSLVELGLELDPVKSESVEEGGQALHQYWESDN